jgi:hypothetical protein
MRLTTVIVIVAVAAIIALVLLGRDGGPRITQITRRREKESRKDDDA